MSERQLMKAKLLDIKGKAKEIEQKARLHREQIGAMVNPLLKDFDNMDAAGIATLAEELVELQAEYFGLNVQIENLKQELYG